ncbi:MAG: DUF1838 family protein [Erythrobacter sp.]
MSIKFANRLSVSTKSIVMAALCLAVMACQPGDERLSPEDLSAKRDELNEILADPADRIKLIAKVFGSTEEAERHAFLKFHIFGFTGEGNLIPLFTMNNYVIQKWEPGEDGTFKVQHYEVAYYSKFDTDEAISEWVNPLTGETIELPHFVLGPVPRFYAPDMADGTSTFAPNPMNITMIGDRVYIPTLSRIKLPNSLTVEEWGAYGGAPTTFWDSMLVYSANISDVLDEDRTSVTAEIHMQNLVSWAPYLKLGDAPGRTMVRAYGQHISGYDALPETIRENLKTYTPEIFDLENWKDVRIDSVDLMKSLAEEREKGTLDIDQPDYTAPRVKKFDEIEDL